MEENKRKVVDSFILNDGIDVDIEAGADYVSVGLCGTSIRSHLLFTPDEAERIARAMLSAVAHIDPERTKRIDVILRGAGLTP